MALFESLLGNGFLVAFFSNYGLILYHFQDKSDILVENGIFFTALAFDAPHPP